MRHFSILVLALLLSTAHLSAQTNIRIDPASVMEGGHLVFKVWAEKVSSNIALDVHVSGISATLNSDFTQPIQQITFSSDTLKQVQEIHVYTLNDETVEGDEEISLFLTTDDQGINLPKRAIGTIKDDDKANLTITDAKANEGDSLIFIVTVDKEVVGGFTLDVEITHGSEADRQTSNNVGDSSLRRPIPDIDTRSRKLLFRGKKGEQQRIVVIALIDKTPNEAEEEFNVRLKTSNPEKLLIPPPATGLIHDDTPCRHCPSLSLLKSATRHELLFFGDGSLVKTFQDNDDLAANTGLGVRWIESFADKPDQKFGWWSKVEIEGHVNVASTLDSISATYNSDGSIRNMREFGRTILVPKSAGQSGDLRLTLTHKNPALGIISGLYFRYVGANRNWQRNVPIDTLGNSEVQRDQVNMHMIRAGIFHDFVNYRQRDDFSVQLRLCYAVHWIGGDLSLDRNAPILYDYILSNQQRHRGWEAAFNFRLSNLEAEFAYISLYDKPGYGQIAGLHNGRLVTTIRFVGGFKAKLDKSK